jgi:uncharacterized protein DUF262
MEYIPIRVSDIIRQINRDLFLPAIQREFVWGTDRVERLFDSIMADFPIGSFLYWKLREEHKDQWPIYEFIRDFDVESSHNRLASMARITKDITLVLDGQQRITSLLIGLQGSYRYFYYRWRKTHLYLNLLKYPEQSDENPEELTYEFAFRENSGPSSDKPQLWYRIGRILDFDDAENAKQDVETQLAGLSKELRDNANRLIWTTPQPHPHSHRRQLLRGEIPRLRQGVASLREGKLCRSTPRILRFAIGHRYCQVGNSRCKE